jgi:hypothetical protein
VGASLVVLAVWWLAGPAAYRTVRTFYYWNACLGHTLPEGQVVYDDDPVQAQALLAADPALRQLGPAVAYVSPAYESMLGGPRPPTPLVFLHGRRSRAGRQWLVAVEPTVYRYPSSRQFNLDVTVKRRLRGSTYVGPSLAVVPTSDIPAEYPPVALRLYAGQADPADESHFTVRYRAGDVTGTIHGWLDDLNDERAKIRFDVRRDAAP